MLRLPHLSASNLAFPSPHDALDSPNGLLAFGGDLSVERLLAAYRRGIFPWYSNGEPILWWSPDPRMVFATATPHIPRRLRRWLSKCSWQLRIDTAFTAVMRACAASRGDHQGTWITDAMCDAYAALHQQGHAHSVEVWDGVELIGGIYGVAVGRMFFGESMFSRRDHASKVALLALCQLLDQNDFPWLDAQIPSSHLSSLGGQEMPRSEFLTRIAKLVERPGMMGSWRERSGDVSIPALAARTGISAGAEKSASLR